jgi:hypothetical protein
MAEIVSSLEPGQYYTSQALTVTFPPGTRKAIITRDDRSPVLTEILAYDIGSTTITNGAADPSGPQVERPFMAVTQDGRGNVVYDGGFPKFYNVHIQNANGGTYPATLPTTLAGLAPACKYLLNALTFIANPRKTALGNRKILFLNNTVRSGQYNILKSHYNPDPQQNTEGSEGFRDTFDAVCAIGGWVPTYFDVTSQGGTPIDVSLATMDQYCAIVFLASRGENTVGQSYITPACTQNIAQFRAAGNGVAIITDHCGANYTSVADAVANGSVFGGDATKVSQHFGAYFSGNVDRSPVQVSEIRRQIGLPGAPEDHPLLAGMSDSEFIFAGGSESIIIPELFTSDVVDETQPWSITFSTAGTYRVNVLVQLDDGSIVTKPMRFTIINPSDINLKDSFNRGDSSGTMITYKRLVDYTIDAGAQTNTLNGQILVENALVGYFTATKVGGIWNTAYMPLAGPGAPMPSTTGQVLKFKITDPFEYTVVTTIQVPDPTPYYVESGGVANFIGKLRTHPYYTGKTDDVIMTDLTGFTDKYYPEAKALGPHTNGQWWKTIGKARLPFSNAVEIDPAKVRVYPTTANWNANKPAVGVVGNAVIIADNNDVYYWDDLPIVWTKHAQKAQVVFTLNRKVVNTLDATNWVIGASSTTKIT